jgi:hypothetical protein
MFDDKEVPENVRRDIFEMVKKHPSEGFLCETRAETLSEDKLKKFSEIFSGKKTTCVELGFESANKWVRKYSVNKDLSDEDFLEAIRLLKKYNIFSIANVIVGAPFLSPKQSIDDAVSSIKWLLNNGIGECVLFPVHVKRGTVVEALWKYNLYQPPSIWSLIEVMKILGEKVSSKITISWYKPYERIRKGMTTNTNQDLNCLRSPTTCPKCYNQVIGLLDEYRKNGDYDIIDKLSRLECECKNQWKKSIENEAELSPSDCAKKAYKILGMNILGKDWWKENGEDAISKVDGYTAEL